MRGMSPLHAAPRAPRRVQYRGCPSLHVSAAGPLHARRRSPPRRGSRHRRRRPRRARSGPRRRPLQLHRRGLSQRGGRPHPRAGQPGDQDLPRPQTRIQALYNFNSDWSPLPVDVVELAQKPYVQDLFAKPFSTFILVITPVTVDAAVPRRPDAGEAAAERDQMYRLTKYLLTAYADSGKTFILQNWEGDHILVPGAGLDGADPDPVRVQGMIDWWNARQDGVQQARQEIGSHDVRGAPRRRGELPRRGHGRQGDGDQQRHPLHPLRPLLLLELGHRLHPRPAHPRRSTT